MAVQHRQRSASSELPIKLAAFVQKRVYRPDRGQYSVLLAAHPPNGGQQPLSITSRSRMRAEA
jgi:hypothetical protein